MGKRPLYTDAPFDRKTGNLLSYPHDPDERNDWRTIEPFHATLHIQGTIRGYSAAHFLWKDTKGHVWPMFMSGMVDLMERHEIHHGKTEGWFVVTRRGVNYGIRLCKAEEIAEATRD